MQTANLNLFSMLDDPHYKRGEVLPEYGNYCLFSFQTFNPIIYINEYAMSQTEVTPVSISRSVSKSWPIWKTNSFNFQNTIYGIEYNISKTSGCVVAQPPQLYDIDDGSSDSLLSMPGYIEYYLDKEVLLAKLKQTQESQLLGKTYDMVININASDKLTEVKYTEEKLNAESAKAATCGTMFRKRKVNFLPDFMDPVQINMIYKIDFVN